MERWLGWISGGRVLRWVVEALIRSRIESL